MNELIDNEDYKEYSGLLTKSAETFKKMVLAMEAEDTINANHHRLEHKKISKRILELEPKMRILINKYLK